MLSRVSATLLVLGGGSALGACDLMDADDPPPAERAEERAEQRAEERAARRGEGPIDQELSGELAEERAELAAEAAQQKPENLIAEPATTASPNSAAACLLPMAAPCSSSRARSLAWVVLPVSTSSIPGMLVASQVRHWPKTVCLE